MNKDHYPRLNFPEIYLLEGGYKNFYYNCIVSQTNTSSIFQTEIYFFNQ